MSAGSCTIGRMWGPAGARSILLWVWLAACGSEVIQLEGSGAGPPNDRTTSSVGTTVSSTTGGAGGSGGEAQGGAPPEVPCLGLVQVGGVEPLLTSAHPAGTSLSSDGLLVASRGGIFNGELELHWFDPWSTWPPSGEAERGFIIEANADLAPSAAGGVSAAVNRFGVSLRLDITAESDGYAPLDLPDEHSGRITRIGNEYVLVTIEDSFEVRRWRWLDATGALTRERADPICFASVVPVPAVLPAPTGPGTWIVTATREDGADCETVTNHSLGLYVVDGENDAPPVVLDDSPLLLSIHSVVGKPGSLGVVFGRYDYPGPHVNPYNELFFLPLQDDGAPSAAPQPLAVTGYTHQPSAVIPVSNGFVIGRFSTEIPTNQHVAVALFDPQGNLLEETVTDVTTVSSEQGIVAHRSPDGRSILLTWSDQGEPMVQDDDALVAMRFDCLTR